MKNGDTWVIGMAAIGVIVLMIFLITITPLCLLWGTNILLSVMGLATIPITLKTWFGAFLIAFAVRGGSYNHNKKN